MAEMIEVACPTCGTPNPLDDAAAGTQVVCVTCRSRFVVPAKAPAATAGGPPPRPGAPRGGGSEADLPAPKRPTAMASLDLDDLLGPAGVNDVDLPAPRHTYEPSRRAEPVGDVTALPAP